MDVEVVLAIGGLAFAILGAAAGIVWRLSKIDTSVQTLTKQLTDLMVKHDHTTNQISEHGVRLSVLEHDRNRHGDH